MKSVFVKILSLFLCILMLAGLLAACKKNPPSAGDNTNEEQQTKSKYELDANGYIKDSITQTFNGTTINVLTWNERRDYLFPKEDSTKDPIVSAVYKRNLDLSDRLDIFLNVDSVNGGYTLKDTFIKQAELAGDLGFDIICSYSLWPSVLATTGALYNLNNLSYPELDMPWWSKVIKEWEQYGSLFFVAGNSSIPVINSMEICFANLNMLEQNGLKDPIQLVLENKWTMEELITAAETIGRSYDADNSPIYGMVVDEISRIDSFYYGAGFRGTVNNNEGKAELAFTEQTAKDQITTLVSKMGRMFQYEWTTILVNDVTPMKNNQTAFEVASMSNLPKLTDMNYAPLPMPMFDTDQKEYYTTCNNAFDVWCIPVSAANAEISAVVIEAFASSDYRTLAPLYYEKNLKLRYSSGDDGMRVFDIIRNAVSCDFGRISAESIGIVETPFRKCFWDYTLKTTVFNNQYSSLMDGKLPTYSNALGELLQAYRKYKDR